MAHETSHKNGACRDPLGMACPNQKTMSYACAVLQPDLASRLFYLQRLHLAPSPCMHLRLILHAVRRSQNLLPLALAIPLRMTACMFESVDDSFTHIDCIDYMKCHCKLTFIKFPPCKPSCPSSLLA